MDLFGHISYLCFLERTGTVPHPEALTMPAGIERIQRNLPSPDPGDGERYRRWAGLYSAKREEFKKAALDPANLRTEFSQANYEAQQPPLYYWILSFIYRYISDLPVDQQNLILSLFSLLMAALAMPSVYLIFKQVLGGIDGLLAALMVAWLPNYMPFLGRITNDCLSFPLFSWAIYLLVRNNNSLLHRMAAVVLVIAALFTKSYSLVLIPLALFGIWDFIGSDSSSASRLRTGIALTPILISGVACLFFFNWTLSGNWLLLTEVRAAAHASLAQKITGIFFLDPVWFYLNGLIRLFWWSGFWSMVSPGIYYYAPLAAFSGIAGYGLLAGRAWRDRSFWKQAFPHLAVVVSFVAGMAWHASLFAITNARLGSSGRSGNEGWYLLTIAPSIFLLLLLPIKWFVAERRRTRVLRILVAGMIVWNLIGRLSSYMYWSGSVHIHHFMRGMDLKETLIALFDSKSWDAWLSLPGIIHPVWLFSICPLVCALISSFYLVRTDHEGSCQRSGV